MLMFSIWWEAIDEGQKGATVHWQVACASCSKCVQRIWKGALRSRWGMWQEILGTCASCPKQQLPFQQFSLFQSNFSYYLEMAWWDSCRGRVKYEREVEPRMHVGFWLSSALGRKLLRSLASQQAEVKSSPQKKTSRSPIKTSMAWK